MKRAIAVFILLLGLELQAQELRLLEWNVENMFHPSDDPLTADEDFTPGGSHRWTYGRFAEKANRIAQVVAAERPALIALCEIEDDSTMTWLAERSVMRTLGYRWLRTHGCDRRGINTALVYDPFVFRPIATREIRIDGQHKGFRPTRNILYIMGQVRGALGKGKGATGETRGATGETRGATEETRGATGETRGATGETGGATGETGGSQEETRGAGGMDTLHIIVCHLPSQAGGTRSADKSRQAAASRLQELADSILGTDSTARIIVTGDFNSDSRSQLIKGLFSGRLRHVPFDFAGTYRFQGTWSHLDHVFCSPTIIADTVHVVRTAWLLENNSTHGGQQPRRTFRGKTYHGGVSDHLPTVLTFRLGQD